MSSIASDLCDDDMGSYEYEDDGDYRGYDDSHDHEPYGDESYYFRGEYEENGSHT